MQFGRGWRFDRGRLETAGLPFPELAIRHIRRIEGAV
jgi:hypothetical protein